MGNDNNLFEKRMMKKINILASKIRAQYVCEQNICLKKAYLTIDDAPTIDSLVKLSILLQKQIPAIWFCIGKEIEKHKDIVIRIIKEGGVIGNHSYSHIDFSQSPIEKCLWEINKTDKIIDECYREANVERKIKLFRFPFGNRGMMKIRNESNINKNQTKHANSIQNYLYELGYKCPDIPNINYKHYIDVVGENASDMYWTYDVMEWALIKKKSFEDISNIEDVLQLMNIDMPNKWLGLNSTESDEIILMHDHVETTKYFEKLVCALQNKGIMFESILNIED